MQPLSSLSRREREIMEILFARGSASANDVVEAMDAPPSRTSVRTILRILEEKGHVVHSQKGREYIYIPKHKKKDAGITAFRKVLKTFFGGSLERAVAAHLTEAEDLSPEELKRLQRLIDTTRNEGPTNDSD